MVALYQNAYAWEILLLIDYFYQLFALGKVNIVDYSTIFTEPEDNNCFSIIAQVIIRASGFFSFNLLVSSLKTSRNRIAAILNISGSVL